MTTPKKMQASMYKLAGERKVFEQAKGYAFDYLDGIFDRQVYSDEQALANLKQC
jgi:hypothetical protein